jgi:putative two-component system response regulator
MQRHTDAGSRILGGSALRPLRLAASVALSHHERFDGSGYPRGLAGQQIPLEGRIAAVADVYDTLTRDRVYRAAMAPDMALRVMRNGRSTHFDPEILDVLLALAGG